MKSLSVFVILAGCLLLYLPRPTAAQQQSDSHSPPNIILFLADDQGWTGTSVAMDRSRNDSKSDYYRTPSLERLAKEGSTPEIEAKIASLQEELTVTFQE